MPPPSSHHSRPTSTSRSEGVSPGPGRKRSAASHQAILEATLAVLEEAGYGKTSLEAIAMRAGVGKQTIYRWWPSRGALILEALTAHASTEIPVPDTGSARKDLERFFSETFAQLRGKSGLLVRSLMAEAQLDSGFRREFRETFIASRREALRTLLLRSRPLPAASADLLLDISFGTMWYRLLVEHAPLNRKLACQLAALAVSFPETVG